MKCFEILYNSSEYSRSGSVGFGVRTQSENIPDEYLKVIRNEEYQKGKFRTIYANELIKDTSRILEYPVSISYKKLKTDSGKLLYILRRSVALEFDYAYYASGQVTRPGNYATHTLIFDEQPNSSVFNLIYEKPANNSRYFRPLNRIPSPNNEELRSIMLGKMEDLPVLDLDCNTLWKEPISPLAYNILFYFIEARRQKKSLVVKIAENKKLQVIADVCRLMYNYAKDITFACSYTQSIDPNASEITYITEYNSAIEIPELPTYMICNADVLPDTNAATKYYNFFKNAIDNQDHNTAVKICGWLLSADYEFVSNASPESSISFFNYCYNQDSFNEYDLLNQELMSIIAQKHKGSKEHYLIHSYIEKILLSSLSASSSKPFIETASLVNTIKECGIDISPAITNVKQQCCAYISSTPDNFVDIYTQLSNSIFDTYISPDMLADKKEYITHQALFPHLKKLYRYFFANPSAEISVILSKLIYRIPAHQIVEILRDANADAIYRGNCYIQLIKANIPHVRKIWEVVTFDIGNNLGIDLIDQFKDHITNPDFAEIFYYDFKNSTKSPEVRMNTVVAIMAQNEEFANLLVSREATDKNYKILFNKFINLVTTKNAEKLALIIYNTVIKPFDKKFDITEWILLYKLILNDEWCKELSHIDNIYNIASRIKDKHYFEKVSIIKLQNTSPKDLRTIKDILKRLNDVGSLKFELIQSIIKEFPHEKQTKCLGCYFKLKGTPFKEVLTQIGNLQFYNGDDVLTKFYESEYKKYQRKEAIKDFLKKLFHISKKDK